MPSKVPFFRPSYLPKAKEVYDAQSGRQEDNAFYQGRRWRKLRGLYIREFPLCAECGRPGEIVHHVIPRHERPDLEYDWENLETLCRKHHGEVHGKDYRDR